MKDAGIKTSQLARDLGVSYQAVKKVLEGGSSALNTENNAAAARILGVNSDWLATGQGERLAPKGPATPTPTSHLEYAGEVIGRRLVPVVGTAKMGDDGYYEELSSVPGAGDGHLEHSSRDPHAYALRVRGDSMHPAIRDGSYVVIEPNGAPVMGEYVLVKLRSGQKMVKELLIQRPDSIEIMSVNGSHRRTVYNDELESVQPVAAIFSRSKWKPD